MSIKKFTFYKGENTSTQYDFDENIKLKEVRTDLVLKEFMNQEESDDFRFIDFKNTVPKYTDMIMGLSNERYAPLDAIQGLNGQIYMTNINKKKDVDLVGFNTDWFWDRFMGCKVSLNNEAKAKVLNKGKFPPLMLTNVKAANPNIRGIGAMDKVVVCEKDSIISFGVRSWGAAGYGFHIKPEAGTAVNNSLYVSFSGCNDDGNYATTGLSRYYSGDEGYNGKMIKVVPTASLNIGGRTLQYMKFSIKTWKVTEFKSKGKTYTCNKNVPFSTVKSSSKSMTIQSAEVDTPYKALGKSQTVVPGSDISPGTTVPSEERSSQTLGSAISNVKQDKGPNGTIGEVTFYMFVFNSKEDAKAVFEGINDLNPNVWS